VRTLSGRLGLVPATRPADVLAAVGWQGPANSSTDLGPLTAVLRSWEDRFDAVVVGVGFDTLTLAVGRPPAGRADALAVAAEHWAVCSDLSQGLGSVAAQAKAIQGSWLWTFWWD
jgi:hypothetical protein